MNKFSCDLPICRHLRREFEELQKQKQLDLKDEQSAQFKAAKDNIRARRARQAREFFVKRRQMADVENKEMQYLRYFGRSTGRLQAVWFTTKMVNMLEANLFLQAHKHVKKQMEMAQRLQTGGSTVQRAQTAR